MNLEPNTLDAQALQRAFRQAGTIAWRGGLLWWATLTVPLYLLGAFMRLAYVRVDQEVLHSLLFAVVLAVGGMFSIVLWPLCVGGTEYLATYKNATWTGALRASWQEWKNHEKVLWEIALPDSHTLVSFVVMMLIISVASDRLTPVGPVSSAQVMVPAWVGLLDALAPISMGLIAWTVGLMVLNRNDWVSAQYWLRTRRGVSKEAAFLACAKAARKNPRMRLWLVVLFPSMLLIAALPFLSGLFVAYFSALVYVLWVELFGSGGAVQQLEESPRTVAHLSSNSAA